MTEKELKNPTFIHLDVNTEYSIGKSVVRIEQLLDQCLNDEIPAVGIADHGNLFSAYKVYKSAIKKGIKPIIGVTLSVEFESSKSDCKLILLCKDQLGYKNLSHMITRSYIDGYSAGEARVNME
ncbi:MAG: PHP domain-containing protein [Gammaproteobacteria bacterium]|nr:PHP domain-containing protein [Gammaproteobacteria bacterium]